MAEYKKYNNHSGPKRPFSGKPSFGGKPSFQKELYDAECNSCHKRCQVPFRPNGKKPVYCTDCFNKQDGRDTRDTRTATFSREPRFRTEHDSGGDTSSRQIQDLKRQIDAMNTTLQSLVTSVETFNRANALSTEVRKHLPEGSAAPEKKAASKKKAAKAAVKKVAKKKKA